jgi:hypothetical protein
MMDSNRQVSIIDYYIQQPVSIDHNESVFIIIIDGWRFVRVQWELYGGQSHDGHVTSTSIKNIHNQRHKYSLILILY